MRQYDMALRGNVSSCETTPNPADASARFSRRALTDFASIPTGAGPVPLRIKRG